MFGVEIFNMFEWACFCNGSAIKGNDLIFIGETISFLCLNISEGRLKQFDRVTHYKRCVHFP